jgi:hypothetical protein
LRRRLAVGFLLLLLASDRQSRQLIEQGLGHFQVERVEAFGEPAVDWSKQFASLLRLPLRNSEPRHDHRGAAPRTSALEMVLTSLNGARPAGP